MLASSLLPSLLLLSTSTLASPVDPILVPRSPVTLSLARRLNLNATSAHALVEHDLARARMFKTGNSHPQATAPGAGRRGLFGTDQRITNQAVSYVASVGVGSPSTTCKFALVS